MYIIRRRPRSPPSSGPARTHHERPSTTAAGHNWPRRLPAPGRLLTHSHFRSASRPQAHCSSSTRAYRSIPPNAASSSSAPSTEGRQTTSRYVITHLCRHTNIHPHASPASKHCRSRSQPAPPPSCTMSTFALPVR